MDFQNICYPHFKNAYNQAGVFFFNFILHSVPWSRKKKGLKIIKVRRTAPLSNPLLPCSVMGIVELLSNRNAAGRESLLFYQGYDSGAVQSMNFVVLTLLTHLCNFSKCSLKLVLLLAATSYTKAFFVDCKRENQPWFDWAVSPTSLSLRGYTTYFH